MKYVTYLSSLFCLLVLSLPGMADEASVTDEIMKTVDEGFTEVQRRVIKRYYEDKYKDKIEDRDNEDDKGKDKKAKKDKGKKGLPPGLANKDKLPPGLEKQLQKNGTLPPGLAKRDLPDDLRDRLGKPPKGYERTIVDNDVVLVEAATRKVVDILYDVVVGD